MEKLTPATLTEEEKALVEKHGGCSTCGTQLTFCLDSKNEETKLAKCEKCGTTYCLGKGPFVVKITKHFAAPDFDGNKK